MISNDIRKFFAIFFHQFINFSSSKNREQESGSERPSGASVKKNYENKESCTPPRGMPPEPTDTPTEAAQAQATAQPTDQRQPK